jgi:Flp pilus assembly protein TadG
MSTKHASAIHRFTVQVDGGITVHAMFTFLATAMLGGYAIDVSNVMSDRTRLQNIADVAAHTAILEREHKTEANAKISAIKIVEDHMPTSIFGAVSNTADIVFGVWNADTATFVETSGSRDAVRVTLRQTAANGNAVQTFLLGLVGFDAWDLTVDSTFVAYEPSCFREGFVAEAPVDIQSNNAFYNGFCIHSNDYVSLNSNNYFEPGTVVSMPDLAELDIPNSGFETNAGLSEALRSGSYHIRILNRIDNIVLHVDDPGSRYYPDYLTSTDKEFLTQSRIDVTNLTPGKVHYWNCAGGKGTIEGGTFVHDLVIVSDCEITFGADVVVENAVIATSSTSSKSFNSPSGFQLGRNDNCADGGGAQLVTLGGMNFAANLQMYGSQLLALGDIEFAARADGVQGASMVSGKTISGTSNMQMGHCGTGMDDNFQSSYFRMVD